MDILKAAIRIFAVSLALCAVVSLLLFSAWPAESRSFHNAPASAQAMKNPYQGYLPAAAASSYHLRCASCHGDNGQGTGNIPALASGQAQSARDGELFWYITKGDMKNGMPSWETLRRAAEMADRQLYPSPRQFETGFSPPAHFTRRSCRGRPERTTAPGPLHRLPF